MALRAPCPVLVCCSNENKKVSQLGFDFVFRQPNNLVNLRVRSEWECFSYRAITPVEDDVPATTNPDVVEEKEEIQNYSSNVGFHSDLNSLPSK